MMRSRVCKVAEGSLDNRIGMVVNRKMVRSWGRQLIQELRAAWDGWSCTMETDCLKCQFGACGCLSEAGR